MICDLQQSTHITVEGTQWRAGIYICIGISAPHTFSWLYLTQQYWLGRLAVPRHKDQAIGKYVIRENLPSLFSHSHDTSCGLRRSFSSCTIYACRSSDGSSVGLFIFPPARWARISYIFSSTMYFLCRRHNDANDHIKPNCMGVEKHPWRQAFSVFFFSLSLFTFLYAMTACEWSVEWVCKQQRIELAATTTTFHMLTGERVIISNIPIRSVLCVRHVYLSHFFSSSSSASGGCDESTTYNVLSSLGPETSTTRHHL